MLDFCYFRFLYLDLSDLHVNQISIDEYLNEVVITLTYSLEVFENIYELGRRVGDSVIYTYDPHVEVYNDIIKARFPFENIRFVYDKFNSTL